MASATDIILRLRGENQTGGMFSKIRGSLSETMAMSGMALQQVGQQMLSFGTSAVQAAANSSKEWGQLTSNIRSSSGSLAANENEIKQFTISTSNAFGRTISDTRAAENNLAKYGMKWGEVKQMMTGVAQIAAGTGQTEEQASQTIISAMAGRGQALKKLGLNINDYKDKTTGAINKTKLLADIQKKFGGAAEAYAKGPEAQMNKLNNAIGVLKVSIGKGLLAILEPLIPIVTGIANALNGWLKPLTPIIAGVIALGGGLALLGGYAMMIQPIVSIFKNLELVTKGVELAQTLYNGALSIYSALTAEVTSAEVASAAAHAGQAGVLTEEAAATQLAAMANGELALAELAALWPILAIIAAIAIFVVALEKVGEYFGWWSDWGTMLQSIEAGVKRLWAAFVNSPQVKQVMTDLTNAFNTLKSVIGPVVSAIAKFFNVQDKGKNGAPDVVASLINAFSTLGSIIGVLYSVITAPIRLIYMLITNIGNIPKAFQQAITRSRIILNMFVVTIITIFNKILLKIRQSINKIINTIVKAFTQLPKKVKLELNKLLISVLQFAVRLLVYGIRAGRNLVNGMLLWVRQLPTRVYQFLLQMIARVLSIAGQAYSAAANIGNNLLNGIMSIVSTIKDKVYDEFMGVVNKVLSVGGAAYNAAKNVGKQIWDGFNSQFQRNSPGRFMKNTQAEFTGLTDIIRNQAPTGYSSAQTMASNIVKGFGKPRLNIGTNLNTAGLMNRVHNINAIGGANAHINSANRGRQGNTYYITIGKQEFDLANLTETQAKRVVNLACRGEGSSVTQ